MKQLTIFLFISLIFFSCKSPEARLPETVSSGSFYKESIERNKKLNEREHKRIKQIIDNDSENEYIASESGFWYYYHNKVEQDTITADFGDVLNFNYNIKDLDGNLIYSEEELGPQSYAMDQEEIFTGLREGLKLMKPSETITFFFPSQKAYGYYGDTKKIGTNIPLICKVTLNTITQNKDDE
ncbi:gliding motility-associated peptidyl-prolyl isomerase GldI [Winogradskyella sp. 3972H.M.0a.05]|uniref:gliding motility-associated peptidyl-prolyl isomerase GldI n=1 Tax=Winogradskyella sp. 3972H.M.0a.05 TaxID=2950277 RepID=UPI0033934A82